MTNHNTKKHNIYAPDLIRKLLLAWILAATVSYAFNPGDIADNNTLARMSFYFVVIITAILFGFLLLLGNKLSVKAERWGMTASYFILAALSLKHSYTIGFLIVNIFVFIILLSYSIWGWNCSQPVVSGDMPEKRIWYWITTILAFAFFLFVSIWTVCRVYTFSTPTYDFGIFSQMFYNMKEYGLPITTVERDGALSHFLVHMSPIYYLLLPFYIIFPAPETLQVLQAAVLTSAVIPLWKLGKHHGLSPSVRTLLCGLLFLYPAFSGGASYDIHENAFLTPLILWLLYGLDRKNSLLTCIFCILLLMVKEDSAVYAAVIALYLIIRAFLTSSDTRRWDLCTGIFMLILSVGWFLLITNYLASSGDGVMTYRYDNFIYDDSASLFTVIKAVIMCPLKAVYECIDSDKLQFIGYTLLPLLGLPLLTRRYERYLLLIPYVLVNLMSDYQYQHDIFFQYTYGSTACLFYLTVVNLADKKFSFAQFVALVSAVAFSFVCFVGVIIPKAKIYPENYLKYTDYYTQVQQTLDIIPDGVSVGATTFYTTYLSQRETLYDVRYASTEHLLSCEYIALSVKSENCYKAYAVNGEDGFENLVSLLLEKDYTLLSEMEGIIQIYKKA